MKKLLLGLSGVVLLSSAVWSDGWGILSHPSYENSAEEACSKFNAVDNGMLDYVYGMQPASPNVAAQRSIFRKQLVKWDAEADWKTERGTLQILWGKTGQADPAQGWPVIPPELTLAELQMMFAMLPD